MRPVQLGLPFIARIFHGPLYNSEGKSLSCAVPEHQRCPPPTFRRIFHTTMKTRNVGKHFVTCVAMKGTTNRNSNSEGKLKKGIFQILPSEIIKSNVSSLGLKQKCLLSVHFFVVTSSLYFSKSWWWYSSSHRWLNKKGRRKKSGGNVKARFLWGGKCRTENSSWLAEFIGVYRGLVGQCKVVSKIY